MHEMYDCFLARRPDAIADHIACHVGEETLIQYWDKINNIS
jgi:hypothetical protein